MDSPENKGTEEVILKLKAVSIQAEDDCKLSTRKITVPSSSLKDIPRVCKPPLHIYSGLKTKQCICTKGKERKFPTELK